MKKTVRFLTFGLSAILIISACCIGIKEKQSLATKDTLPGVLFWYDEEAENCKFYATIDGVTRECTREEYALYGVRYSFEVDGKIIELNAKEYRQYIQEGAVK